MKKESKSSVSKIRVKTRFSRVLTNLQNNFYPNIPYKDDLLNLFEILHFYQQYSDSDTRVAISDMFEQFMLSHTTEYTIEQNRNTYKFFKLSVTSFIEAQSLIEEEDVKKIENIFLSVEKRLGL